MVTMPHRSDDSRFRLLLKYVAPFALMQLVLWAGLAALARMSPGLSIGWAVTGAWAVTVAAVVVLLLRLRGELLAPARSIKNQVQGIGPGSLNRRIEGCSPREVREMSEAVNDMLDRVEGGYAEQARFIGNVSHELRTPLTYLLGQAQLMRRRGATPEEFDQFVDDTMTEVRRMKDTVHSFLTLARASGGLDHLTVTHVQASDLVLEAMERCHPLAHHRAVRIVPSLETEADEASEASVRGDADLLTALVENLLRNAIQHSPPDGQVDISLSSTSKDVAVTVRDRGPGLPEEKLETVFERYRNDDAKSANQESVGLGLAIAKAVALTHGGSVSARNHPDGGAVFEARLPRANRSRLAH